MRGRTRRVILRAAVSTLAHDRTATLADIADAADVGRSTLHRYFTDRDDLIRAAVVDSSKALMEALEQARIEDGPPLEALRRLVLAHLDAGDRLTFLFGEPQLMRRYGVHVDAETPKAGTEFIRLVERGQAEGVVDPHFSPEWIVQVMWAIVYTGVEQVVSGQMTRLDAAATVVRTFEKAVAAG